MKTVQFLSQTYGKNIFAIDLGEETAVKTTADPSTTFQRTCLSHLLCFLRVVDRQALVAMCVTLWIDAGGGH